MSPRNLFALEVARFYSRENDFYQLLLCGGWHDLLPYAVVLWGCAAGLLKGGQVCTFYGPHLCLRNSLKIATRICQFGQYLGTKLDMLFQIAK